MYVCGSEWRWSVLLLIEFFGDYSKKVENLELSKAPPISAYWERSHILGTRENPLTET